MRSNDGMRKCEIDDMRTHSPHDDLKDQPARILRALVLMIESGTSR